MSTDVEMLNCIGCGRSVARYKPGQMLAISCACGAMSPLLSLKGDLGSMPESLRRLVMGPDRSKPPHLEFYLGYSDHTSELKGTMLVCLKALGSISQADCEEPKCQRAYLKGVVDLHLLERDVKTLNVAAAEKLLELYPDLESEEFLERSRDLIRLLRWDA